MDPIMIHVEIGLKESTIQTLGKIFTAHIGGPAPAAPKPLPPPVETRPAAPAPRPEALKPEASKAPEIDNMTLNTAVKAAQGRGVSKEQILAVFAKYGIKFSRECAPEKRPGLLSELNALQPDLPE